MKRIIHVLCRDGSPLGVSEKTITGDDGQLGTGGAELALLTMCRAWQMYGNDVTLYNNPRGGWESSFKQKTLNEFNPKEFRNILIIFRSPSDRLTPYDTVGKKLWWSCDQYTIDSFKDFSKQVDKIVCISPFHAKYFKDIYGIDGVNVIDLPVRTWEYNDKIPKVPHRCIFTSIPERGLIQLSVAWPKILAEVPDASLTITSDWRLWSQDASPELVMPYRLAFARMPNINYRAAVKRSELIQIQMEAQINTYPSVYPELFCISCAEAQVAGALPITSDVGALATTNMARVIHGVPTDSAWIDLFVKNTVELLNDPKLSEKQEHIREVAMKRFSIETILPQWEAIFG